MISNWIQAPDLAVLAWPVTIALAWMVGEMGQRWLGLPRIAAYAAVGFALAAPQLGFLPAVPPEPVKMLANIAFGLVLFEFGYRINLRWLVANPWLGVTALLEAVLTFALVYGVARHFGSAQLSALLLASLAMATSPATLMRVINEERSSGQVTERALHLAAINCLLAVFAFKAIVGAWTFERSGDIPYAMWNSLVVLAVSAGIGAAFGVAVPAVMRGLGRLTRDATLGFAIGVVLVVALALAFHMSPVLAALTFGFVARHRRVILNRTQRNFGALGDLLSVVLFVFVATTIAWGRVWDGLALGALVIVVRLVAKTAVVGALSHASGSTWRKGVLVGLALSPISVFVILLLEQARYLGVDLLDQVAPLAAATLLMELLGPLLTQRALAWAGERSEKPNS